MKKSEVIEKLKAKTHAIHMNRRNIEDVKLLNELFKVDVLNGREIFYYYHDKYSYLIGEDKQPNLFLIPIAEIETEETFESGEEVETNNWENKLYYVGKSKSGYSVCESETEVLYKFSEIRKVNYERKQAIETIKELMSKFEIKNDEV